MTEISNRVQGLFLSKIDIDTKEWNMYNFFEKQVKDYLKEIAFDIKKSM